jgi:hypothetical protein
MQKNNCEIEVVVNGKSIREYSHNGVEYVEGRQGNRFSLKFRNNTSSRKLFIPSVDGLSILNGENASFDSPGYIVDAYSSIVVDGWRKSASDVARFFFSHAKDSYGAKTGNKSNLGVIGCAVYSEKQKMKLTYTKSGAQSGWGWNENYFYKIPAQTLMMPAINNLQASNLPSQCYTSCSVSSNAIRNQSIGTGWGETIKSESHMSSFSKDGNPTILEMRYDTRKNLEAVGISFEKKLYIAPQSFPGQFCKPPQH